MLGARYIEERFLAARPGASRKINGAGHSARNDGEQWAERPQAFPADVAGNA
jgi:hypothetical protein